MIADIIAEDRNEEPVLFVEVEVGIASQADFDQFLKQFSSLQPPLPYGMLVDLEKMIVVRRDVDHPDSCIELKSTEILRHYDPDFAGKDSRYGTRGIFRDYLVTLVEGWLRDLAYHWKSESPPGAKEVARIGLLERLEEGTTRNEVAIGGHRLS